MVAIPKTYCDRISSFIVNSINSGGVRFSEESIFKEKKLNRLGIPKIQDFCMALLCKNMSRYLIMRCGAESLDPNSLGASLKKSLTGQHMSASLKTSAKFIRNSGIIYYNARPSRAPLFFSPFLKETCTDNGLRGCPPNCLDVMRRRSTI